MHRPFPDCRAAEVLGRARSFLAFEQCVSSANASEALRRTMAEQGEAHQAIQSIEREGASLRSLVHQVETDASRREAVLTTARQAVNTNTECETSLVAEVLKREAGVNETSEQKAVLLGQMKEKVAASEELLKAAEPLQLVKMARIKQAKAAQTR